MSYASINTRRRLWPIPFSRSWALGLSLVAGTALKADDAPYISPSEGRLRSDVGYLADDQRGGRGVGTKGIDDAAGYLANALREAGLKPIPSSGSYFQDFTIRGEARAGSPTSLVFQLENDSKLDGVLSESFSPLAIGTAGKVESLPLVFAGFGITAKDADKKLDYDDYAGIDVKDKAVLILRRDPDPTDKGSGFAGTEPTPFATFTSKAINAAEHGAKLVLLVNDHGSATAKDALLSFDATPGGGAIPFVMISRSLADQILAAGHAPTLDELETKINAELKPVSRELPAKVSAEVTVTREPIAAKNVVGVLEAQGPLANETIVIGAHYDHLGSGGMGSLAFGSRDIHNGADDNASGTATVVELARRLASRPDPLPRRVVFMLFSGEERGLLGSEHYVKDPLFPLDETVAMINFDMVGRLETDKGLTIYGAGSAEGWEPLVEGIAGSLGLKPRLSKGASGEFGQSDHYSFYRKDLPVLFFFTGTHPDYHRPSDDSEKINYGGMARVADLGELMILDIAKRSERPKFVKLASPARESTGQVRGNGAYLGTRPAYGEAGEGVKLEGVSEGSPAEKAGLKGGDVIIKFGELKVVDIEGYMNALGSKKPGDEVEVVVLRDGKPVTVKVTLGTRTRPSQ